MDEAFNTLSLSEKYNHISEGGKYISVREYYNYFINLYLVDEILYELYYFRPSNKIEKIEVLDDPKKLDLYINHMNKLNDKL